VRVGEEEPKLTKEQVLQLHQLPTTGEFPFEPSKTWHPTQPLPTLGGAYSDRRGRLWEKGRSITPGEAFEWDVQLTKAEGGGHLNVSQSGRITHPRPKRKSKPQAKKGRRRKK